MAKTLTKYLQLDFAEEMLTLMIAVVASIYLRLFSSSSAPIRRRQLDGLTTVCYDTQIASFWAWRKLIQISICGT
jgi:hypothetical protein